MASRGYQLSRADVFQNQFFVLIFDWIYLLIIGTCSQPTQVQSSHSYFQQRLLQQDRLETCLNHATSVSIAKLPNIDICLQTLCFRPKRSRYVHMYITASFSRYHGGILVHRWSSLKGFSGRCLLNM
jgi:hypothetical protein